MRAKLLQTKHRASARAIACLAILVAGSLAAAGPQGTNTPASVIGSPATQPMSAETARAIAHVQAEAKKYENAALSPTSPDGTTAANPTATREDGTVADRAASDDLANAHQSKSIDFTRIAAALAIVVALIVGVKLLFNRVFVGAAAPSASRAVKVLGRTPLAPRQQVMLLQVGGRVVVVGESNGNLSTLAQIEDADEVARLIGQLHEEKLQRAASFGGLFGRMQKHYDDPADPSAVAERTDDSTGTTVPAQRNQASALAEEQELSQAKSDLSGLVEKVRALRSQLGQ